MPAAANGRQADFTACLSKSIYLKKLLSSSTLFNSFTCVNLDTPQDQVGDTSKDDGQFETNIHPIRLIDQATYGSGDRMLDAINCEYLSKTKKCAKQTKRHRHYSGPASRESNARIPIIDIVLPMSVHKVFDDENDRI